MSSIGILCFLSNLSQIADILIHSIIVICPCRIYCNAAQVRTKCIKFDLCFRSSINFLDCLLISFNIFGSSCSSFTKRLNLLLQCIQSIINLRQYFYSLSCSSQQLSLICTGSSLIRIILRFSIILLFSKLAKFNLQRIQFITDISSLISILLIKLRCFRITNCIQDSTFSINQILS